MGVKIACRLCYLQIKIEIQLKMKELLNTVIFQEEDTECMGLTKNMEGKHIIFHILEIEN